MNGAISRENRPAWAGADLLDREGSAEYPLGIQPLTETMTRRSEKAEESQEARISGLWGWAAERLGIPAWGQVLVLALLAIFGWLFVKMDRIETGVSRLKEQQASFQQQLLLKLLDQASRDVQGGNEQRAAANLRVANVVLEAARSTRIPAGSPFFERAWNDLEQLGGAIDEKALEEEIRSGKFALAEYRSALVESPRLKGDMNDIDMVRDAGPVGAGARIGIAHAPIFRWTGPPGGEFFRLAPGPSGLLPEGVVIQGIVFLGGSQTLDMIQWVDTVFVNTNIKYRGGTLYLQNVQFVNCTFEFASTQTAELLAGYVARDLSVLRVGKMS